MIDDKTFNHLTVAGRQHRLGADNSSNDATAVDISHQHDRRVGWAGKAHISDIAGAQINFGSTAGTFDQDQISLLAQALKTIDYRR